jgi:hypothetical protein
MYTIACLSVFWGCIWGGANLASNASWRKDLFSYSGFNRAIFFGYTFFVPVLFCIGDEATTIIGLAITGGLLGMYGRFIGLTMLRQKNSG